MHQSINNTFSYLLMLLLVPSFGLISTSVAANDDNTLTRTSNFTAIGNPLTRPTNFILTDVTDLTTVSGYTGNLTRINVGTYKYSDDWFATPPVVLGRAFAGIQSIKWEEQSNKPCWMEVKPWPLNTEMIAGYSDPRRPPTKRINICNNSNRGDAKSVFTAGYVTAIAVCTTNKKDSYKNRLKGIKLWGATLSKQAPLVRDITSTPEKAEHKNCKGNWQPKVSCPTGYIAAGIKIHDIQKKYFRGLSLKCRKVELSRSPFR